MKKFILFICSALIFSTSSFAATNGTTTIVLYSATAATATVCLMTTGMVKDLTSQGLPLQTYVCDSLVGYSWTGTQSINLTGYWFYVQNTGSGTIQYYHGGGSTANALNIVSGGFWQEGIRQTSYPFVNAQ